MNLDCVSTCPDELLTTEELAREFKKKPSTLEKWRSQKTQPLKYVKIGSAVRYRRQDVVDFLNKQTQSARSDEF